MTRMPQRSFTPSLPTFPPRTSRFAFRSSNRLTIADDVRYDRDCKPPSSRLTYVPRSSLHDPKN